MNITATTSLGASDNVKQIYEGKAKLAIVPDGLEARDSITALAKLETSSLRIVVRKDDKRNPINSLFDLRRPASNRIRAYVGSDLSATRLVAKEVLSQYGIALNDLDISSSRLSFDEAAERLIVGKLDCGFFLPGATSSSMMKIAASGEFKLLTIELAAGIADPGGALDIRIIPRDLSGAEFPPQDILTVAARVMLVCDSSLADIDAYNLLDTLNQDNVVLPAGTELKSPYSQSLSYAIHPGAAAYYSHRTPPSEGGRSALAGLATFAAIIVLICIVSLVRTFIDKRKEILVTTARLGRNPSIVAIIGGMIATVLGATYQSHESEATAERSHRESLQSRKVETLKHFAGAFYSREKIYVNMVELRHWAEAYANNPTARDLQGRDQASEVRVYDDWRKILDLQTSEQGILAEVSGSFTSSAVRDDVRQLRRLTLELTNDRHYSDKELNVAANKASVAKQANPRITTGNQALTNVQSIKPARAPSTATITRVQFEDKLTEVSVSADVLVSAMIREINDTSDPSIPLVERKSLLGLQGNGIDESR